MKKKNKQYIADLEECLAGFMALEILAGDTSSTDKVEWITQRLTNAQRSPAETFNEILNYEKTN